MQKFWNQRYSEAEPAYGNDPNEFLKAQLALLQPGRILLPAEGQGRNAVYAASQGWDVTAFDNSEAGRQSALELAANRGVTIDYILKGYGEVELEEASFDAVGLIYAHIPDGMRTQLHRQFWSALKPGGTLILEAFSENQLGRSSGGPKTTELLYSVEKMENDFAPLKPAEFSVEEQTAQLREGAYHSGEAIVIRVVAKK
jgi:SAM-dependent methyltransferase